MNIFLEKILLRKMNILSLLYSENRPFTVKELAIRLGYTSKTILKMIEVLEFELQKWSNTVQLVVKENKEIQLETAENFSLKVIELSYLKESHIFKACEAIFNEDFVDIATFSNENYISYSTLYGRLIAIRPVLKQYQLEFKPNNKAHFLGEEKQLRYFFFHFYWHSSWGMEWPFKGIEKKQLAPFIKAIEGFKNRSLMVSEQEFFFYWLGVISVRIQHKHPIKEIPLMEVIIEGNPKFEVFSQQMYPLFKEHFLLEESQLHNEIKFLFIILFNYTQYELEHPLISEMLVFAQNKAHLVFETTNYWLKRYMEFFDLTLSAAEYGAVYTNLIHLHFRVHFFEGDQSSFFSRAEEKDKKEDVYHLMMGCFYKELLQESKYYPILKHKNELVLNYTLIARKFIKLEIEYQPVRIQLLFVYGKAEALQLSKKLQQMCEVKIEFSYTLGEKVDLIISDRHYEELEYSIASLIIWNEEPKVTDFMRIINLIEELTIQKFKHYLLKSETSQFPFLE
ncbi:MULTISPECIES: helix-turn-helix domain-containing protein [Carnobacterium]|uniref:helix-turn-helix domain-containing protein n=1 Tax=Carnobacterium TaxID=2747 RepID=UPI00288FFB1F|nr:MULTISPECIES: helix-turn-helix domain-containing protein [Carnobacterium]MDT1940334.1 helix-turn-helix domain-containing protein [Carnobacterium divergens]MDT1942772.1 helix-turn-helix domain-containing protein [Carnobacterium divergens]MDT1948578.1 helix-turn-helix domain-containing protein [Carnobacterium divergens]MDT1951059.1 helix-turn-helix domain-containing protein [Carnobacterium divergens]MDT1956117.1 helix-turn-helix domain-containing protein [Carnobacterium divergens]